MISMRVTGAAMKMMIRDAQQMRNHGKEISPHSLPIPFRPRLDPVNFSLPDLRQKVEALEQRLWRLLLMIWTLMMMVTSGEMWISVMEAKKEKKMVTVETIMAPIQDRNSWIWRWLPKRASGRDA